MNYFSPETLSRIARLQVRARRVVEGFLSGQHRSPYFGTSVEFRQHREYTFGDDLRNLDWKVLAKQDRFYIKQYEALTNLRSVLAVDSSASMLYQGSRSAMSKYDYACTAAVSLAWLLLRQQDAVGCVRFDQSIRMRLPQKSSRTHLDSIVSTLEMGPPEEKTDIQTVLEEMAQMYPRRGLVAIFSDLLVDRPGFFDGLKYLRAAGNDVIVCHVMDPDELEFEFSGPTRFNGLELNEILRCNPRALRQGYLEALELYKAEIAKGCSAAQVRYELIRSDTPLDVVFSRILNNQ